MPVSFAVLTSDPNLLRCELARLEGELLLSSEPCNAVGLGSYAQDEVLLQRYPSARTLTQLSGLFLLRESEALLYHARSVPGGVSREENTQPFRFRQWLFCSSGVVDQFQRIRMQIWASLPNFLQRQIPCDTESEAAFALFLKALRDAGRLDDPMVDSSLAAQLLGNAARTLGASTSAALSCIATNGRFLVATRHGSESLAYRLFEGSAECTRCRLDAKSPENLPLLRAHRLRKTVVIASHVTRPASWIEIPDATALLIGRGLNIQRLPV